MAETRFTSVASNLVVVTTGCSHYYPYGCKDPKRKKTPRATRGGLAILQLLGRGVHNVVQDVSLTVGKLPSRNEVQMHRQTWQHDHVIPWRYQDPGYPSFMGGSVLHVHRVYLKKGTWDSLFLGSP